MSEQRIPDGTTHLTWQRMNEQIIPVSTDLWLIIEPAVFASDGLFKIRNSIGEDILIYKDEVSALISALHKVLDEHGPKEKAERAEDTARRRTQGAKDGWEIRRAKEQMNVE